jgi:hypothetical protein
VLRRHGLKGDPPWLLASEHNSYYRKLFASFATDQLPIIPRGLRPALLVGRFPRDRTELPELVPIRPLVEAGAPSWLEDITFQMQPANAGIRLTCGPTGGAGAVSR